MRTKQRVGLRFTDEQWNRLMQIKARADARSRGYAPLTDLVKELMGAVPYNLTNEDERSFLAGKLAVLPKSQDPAITIPRRRVRARRDNTGMHDDIALAGAFK